MAVAIIFLALAARPAALSDHGREVAASVDYAQRLNSQLPGDLTFRDESGKTVRLDSYLGGGPLGLVFSYYRCTNLCPMQIHNLAERVAHAPAAAVDQAQMLIVSIDPLDSPALAQRAKHRYLDEVLAPEQATHWHFLTGSADDIARLAQSIGFGYSYDPATRQYAHAAGFTLITPEGRIARYFFGFDFTAEELGQAVMLAGARRIASPIERLLLVCFHDPLNGPYSALIVTVLRAVCIATLLGMLALAAVLRARRLRASES
jgi:protein SCO1/2